MFVNTSCFCKRLKAMRPKKLQVFPLVHFSPQVLTFCLCMHMHIRSKHVWGFFPSVTKNIFCQKFAVPQLIHCDTKCNNILKWGIGHFLYNPWFHGRFHCSNIAVSPQKKIWQEIDSSKKLFGMCSQILSNVHGSFSGTQKQEESGWGSPSSRQPCRGCDRWPPKKIAEADSEGPSFRRTGPGGVSTTRWRISRPLPFQAGYGHSAVCWWPCQSTTSSAVCWRFFTKSSTRSAVCCCRYTLEDLASWGLEGVCGPYFHRNANKNFVMGYEKEFRSVFSMWKFSFNYVKLSCLKM